MTALERDPLFFTFLHYEDKELILKCLRHKTDSKLWPIKGSSSCEEDTAQRVAGNIHALIKSHKMQEWCTLPLEKLHSFQEKLLQLQRKFSIYSSGDLQDSIDFITIVCQQKQACEKRSFLDLGIVTDLREVYGNQVTTRCFEEDLSDFQKFYSGEKDLKPQTLYLICNQTLRKIFTENYGTVFAQFCKTFPKINQRFESSKVFSKEELSDIQSKFLIFQENQLKLSELENVFGKEVYQEYFSDHFSELNVFYSCQQVVPEATLKKIIKDLEFQKELNELRYSLIEAKGRKAQISIILSNFKRLNLKYSDQEKVILIEKICYGLDCLVRASCFLQSDVEKLICDRIPTSLPEANEQEIAKSASQALYDCFITQNLRNVDFVSTISELKEKAFQDRLKMRNISSEMHKPEIFTIHWIQQTEEVARNLCRERVTLLIEYYDQQSCGQFSLFLSRYKGYSPQKMQELLFFRWRETVLKFLQDPSIRFTTISDDAITAEERRIKAFISRLPLPYAYIFNHMQYIQIPHDQNDPSLNVIEGTCLANSLERHLKLLQDPSMLSEDLYMESSPKGRKLYATIYAMSAIQTSKKSNALLGLQQLSMFLEEYDLKLISDSKYAFQSIEELLKPGLDILATRQLPSLLVFGSHIINLQYDPKRLIFRIIDDDIGCLVCNTELEFRTLLKDHLSTFSEDSTSLLIIPTQ